MSKKKILVYGDSPTVKTGFGSVTRNVMEVVHKTGLYDIDIFGINYHGVPHDFPYKIWPAADHVEHDPFGRKKFCYFAMQHDFDILWVLQDTFIVDFLPELISHLKANRKKPFKVMMYYPVDSIIKSDWFKNIKDVDQLVSYTNFGKEETLVNGNIDNIEVIYHGVSTKDFHPLPDKEVQAFRSNYFKSHGNKFIFMNVNRNQQRKDIPRTIMAFSRFKKQVPNSMLYLHMAKNDQGWDIEELCTRFNLSITEDVILPSNFEPNQAYPIEVLNLLYNCCDCVLSTTLGEGFGLGWIEAMACKKPVITPNNTAMKELITKDLGYLVDSGSNDSLWTCIPNDNNILRPLVDVDHMVQVMLDVYNNYTEAEKRADNAYEWVTNDMQWSGDIAKQWQKIFAKLSYELDTGVSMERLENSSNTINAESF
jgi:glycosyltransferase involved in cell wall biosynthesis